MVLSYFLFSFLPYFYHINDSILQAMVLFKWQGVNLLKASIGIERTRADVLSVLYCRTLQMNKDLIAFRVSY